MKLLTMQCPFSAIVDICFILYWHNHMHFSIIYREGPPRIMDIVTVYDIQNKFIGKLKLYKKSVVMWVSE